MQETTEIIVSVEDSRRSRYWANQFALEKKAHRVWRDDARKCSERYVDERPKRSRSRKLNLFSADLQVLEPSIFGQLPDVTVDRQNYDADDDVARVAASILERAINAHLHAPADRCEESIGGSLHSWLISGLGIARVLYESDVEEVEIEAIMDVAGNELAPPVVEYRKQRERVVIDYVHWDDFRWQPSRYWAECGWVAFRSRLTKAEVVSEFGEAAATLCVFGSRSAASNREEDSDDSATAEIWEVWDKTTRKVLWFDSGANQVIRVEDDIYKLPGFFPCPRPLMFFVGTDKYVPEPWYRHFRDQYRAVDRLTERITMLESALKVAGVYDASANGVQRLLTEGGENVLIPVDSWAAFAERGGMKGAVDWMPIDQVASVVTILRDARREEIELLHQLNGISDIMRGQQTQAGATATERRIQAAYGSVRLQDLQDEFARFVTELERLRAGLMLREYDDETLVQAANVQALAIEDRARLPEALQLLRSSELGDRVVIESHKLAAIDYQQVQGERTEFLGAMTQFLNAAAPMAEAMPGSMPYLLRMLQWGMAGFRGAKEIEGVLDQAINQLEQAQKQQPQGQPDPEAMKQQAAAAAKAQELQLKAQAKEREIQLKAQADMAKIRADMEADLARIQAEMMAEQQTTATNATVDIEAQARREANQAAWNIAEEREKARIRAEESMRNVQRGYDK